jgi:hypothetical protein
MKKEWCLIPKIISRKKTIESRWYKSKFAPWNRIQKGDTVYFKNSGDPVTAYAKVSKVLQFENLNKKEFTNILNDYGDKILPISRKYKDYKNKKYCILIFLENPNLLIKTFNINKKGFGSASAWMIAGNIESIKKIT